MRDLLRLLRTLAWCFAAPYIAVWDEMLVRIGLKRRVATGRPVPRRRGELPVAMMVRW